VGCNQNGDAGSAVLGQIGDLEGGFPRRKLGEKGASGVNLGGAQAHKVNPGGKGGLILHATFHFTCKKRFGATPKYCRKSDMKDAVRAGGNRQ